MNHGVKLVSLSVQDVGPLTGRIDLGPFSSGVNVISGRNEVGKSTLVTALRAALFERHDVKHQGIRALQTHGTRNAPEMWVELDIGGERVSVHKRFLERPLVEVRLPGGGAPYLGTEAEELLLARLEGRRAGQRGGTRNDMGLWGLLWVAQDETAHTDPGDKLDDHVRGALSDAVGRQVGQVLGGRRSEQVRTQVLEHAGRFFTSRSNAKTGKYKEAEERCAAADEQVKKIKRAIAETEDLAAQHVALAEQLLEKNRHLPSLEAEHLAAIAARDRVQQLADLAQGAKSSLATAETELDVVQKDVDARSLLTGEAETLREEIKRNDDTIEELRKMLEPLTAAARDARSQATAARTTASDARVALSAENERLETARRYEEIDRSSQALGKAEDLNTELDEAVRQKATGTIEEHTFDQIELLARTAADLRARRDAEGTRIVVYPPDGEPIVRSVAGPSTIEVPELGVLEVQPARPGLARAVVEAGRARAKFEEALLSTGVTTVQRAQERYEARAEAAREAESFGARIQELAPRGLEALEQTVLSVQADRTHRQTALDDAVKADAEREKIANELGSNCVNTETIEALRAKEQEVAILRASIDAMGTHVEIVALANLQLHSGSATAAEALVAGQRAPLTVTKTTRVVLEGIAELRFEPRGEDLAKSRTKLARAESELRASLEAIGVSTMEEAREAARGWARLDDARKRVDVRLKAAAPQGLPRLQTEVEKIREQSHALETSLTEAKMAFALHTLRAVNLAQERVTKEALDRLEKLERELFDRETEVETLCARVRAVDAPITAGLAREWTVFEAIRPEAVAGVVWEIFPGELGGELDVEGIEQRLRDLLASTGLVDHSAAKERYEAGLKLGEQITVLRRQLRSVAPDGLDTLRARVAALGGTMDLGSERMKAEGATEIDVLKALVKQHDQEARAAQAIAEAATDTADRAGRACDAHLGSLRECQGERKTRAERREGLTQRLAAHRGAESDMALSDRHIAALSARHQAWESDRKSAADLKEARAQLFADDVTRAASVLESWRKSVNKLRDDMLRIKTLLDKAAVEGRFEDLAEALAEKAESTEAFAQIEREAAAARLLVIVVEEAYNESQRLFLAPVLKEAAPYLTKLRPGTELKMTRELKLEKIVRHGAEEDFDQLSGGTREQLSLIIRLALARVMARDKRPLPLILDDTMGWTDDSRFLSMVQILRDASSELQIILLTCHPSRFDRFQAGYSVDLDQLKDARTRADPR